MAWQPGQTGNPGGGARVKLWRDAINRAIKRREETDPLALVKLADKLLNAVDDGDVGAMREFGDRIDGKVPQAVIGDDEHDPIRTITMIERRIVRPPDRDGGSVPPAT